VALALFAALPLVACGNALEGGSSPSGSYIRVVSISPNSASTDAFTPDIFLSICEQTVDADGNVTTTYEDGIHNNWVDVVLRNDSAPNTPTGQTTNSFVTMTRYRVDFVGVNKTVSIPSINGAATLGLAPDQQGTLLVLVMGLDTLENIRDNYPTIGNTDTLTLRAHITMWGEDAFQVPVRAEGEVTLVVDNYDRC
jgi:hypothetical protein